MSNKIQIVKTALRLTTQVGTGVVSGCVIANNVPQSPNPFINVSVRVAAFMIGGLASEQTGAYSDRLVDQVVEAVSAIQDNEDTTDPTLKSV